MLKRTHCDKVFLKGLVRPVYCPLYNITEIYYGILYTPLRHAFKHVGSNIDKSTNRFIDLSTNRHVYLSANIFIYMPTIHPMSNMSVSPHKNIIIISCTMIPAMSHMYLLSLPIGVWPISHRWCPTCPNCPLDKRGERWLNTPYQDKQHRKRNTPKVCKTWQGSESVLHFNYKHTERWATTRWG